MLTCAPAVDCVVIEEPEQSACQISCGDGEEITCGVAEAMACEPVSATDVTIVCVIPFSTDTGIGQPCNCDMAPPPFASTAADRKNLESNTSNKLTISFVLAPDRESSRETPRESNLSSIHPTIPVTVLRC